MQQRAVFSDETSLKILSDPYRIRILDEFQRRGVPSTVKQVADALGDSSAKVSFHVKKLLDTGVLAEDHTELIRGITARYFRLVYESIVLKYPQDAAVVSRSSISHLAGTVTAQLSSELEHFHQNPSKPFVMTQETLYVTDAEAEEIRDTIIALTTRLQRPHGDAVPVSFYAFLLPPSSPEKPDD